MRTSIAIGVGASALLVATALPASADDHVLADNLTSPLGFAVADDGSLYVAEAFAGLLTQIDPSGDRTELASAPPGSGTAGVALTKNGSVYYTLTLPPEQGGAPDTALARVNPDGSAEILASLAEFEAENNPDADNEYGVLKDGKCYNRLSKYEKYIGGPIRSKGIIESNPYAVADEGYGSAVVADAAGNSIVRVTNGKVSTVAVLPAINQKLDKDTVRKLKRQVNRKLERKDKDPIKRDYFDVCIGKKFASNPVPTDVEVGPGGNLYVSTLPGFPELPGYARVYRVNPATGALSVVAKGLTGATDLAVADDGTIYVSELFAFQVSTIDPGDRGPSSSMFVDCPTAVEIDSNGDVLVARGGLCGPDPGEIIRLD
jgi:DNA-binding beta-propeller fold protein YncE